MDIKAKSTLAIVAELISSDAISKQFKRTQSMGGFLANFLTMLFNETLHSGFSYYSKEKCHEFIHGEGTCTKELHRDNQCSCMLEISLAVGCILQTTLSKNRYLPYGWFEF